MTKSSRVIWLSPVVALLRKRRKVQNILTGESRGKDYTHPSFYSRFF
jgi:hypothetical protein